MNEYDSNRMLDLLKETQGAELVDDPAEADLLLLNTCSIREKAQEKVFHQLGRWRSLKEAKPHLKIAVGGCVASQEGAAIGRAAAPARGPQAAAAAGSLGLCAGPCARPAALVAAAARRGEPQAAAAIPAGSRVEKEEQQEDAQGAFG